MRFINRLSDYSDETILSELRRVAKQLRKQTLTKDDLKHARLCYETLKHRFGGLGNALQKAGLQNRTFNRNISDVELLTELRRIWDIVLQKEGRYPYQLDLKKYGSKYSRYPYYRRWGSWIKACEAVLVWEENQFHNIKNNIPYSTGTLENTSQLTRSKRQLSLRMRYEILKRDNFACIKCGRSPAICPGLELHIDHKKPLSKGGQTELNNLQTLCQECNIGKGNL